MSLRELLSLVVAHFVVSLTFASFAAASCPQVSVGQSEIELLRQKPFMQIVLRQEIDGLAEYRIREKNGKRVWSKSIYPHPLIVRSVQNKNAKTISNYNVREAIEGLRALKKNKSWQSDITLYQNGKKLGKGRVSANYLDTVRTRVGRCRYSTWVVDVRMDAPGIANTRFRKFYSPKLEVVLKVIKLDKNNQPISGVEFDQISNSATD